jgi:hypothetical protein
MASLAAAFGERGEDRAVVPGADAGAVLDELRHSGGGRIGAGLADLREAPLDDVADIAAGDDVSRSRQSIANLG